MKKFSKIVLLSFLILLCSFTLCIVVINSSKFFIYKDYFNVAKDVSVNEGLGDSYVPQGVTKINVNDQDIFLTSGYMSNGEASRIYVIKPRNTYYVEMKLNDYELSKGHFGGITATKDHVLVASDGKIYVMKLEDILKAEFDDFIPDNPDKNDIKVLNYFETGVDASYIYSDLNNENIYVGEFNGAGYETHHDTLVNDGNDTYHAYIEKYKTSDVISKKKANPTLKLAVRDLVQGFAMSEDKIVLSTSYGLASSNFYVYDIPSSFDDLDNKIVNLDDRYLKQTIKAPALAESLDYDGKMFYTLYDSACNKYIFGKFFFANKIVGMTI